MSFTFLHPAIVLPLARVRRGISLTGLVAGSVAPDFEKYLKMGPENVYSHQWHALLWFNLPMGLLLAFLYHGWVRNALLTNLPELVRRRMCLFTHVCWKDVFRSSYIVVMISVLIGAASHLLWDSFTRYDGFLVEAFSVLQDQQKLGGVKLTVFHMLDWVSTVVGAGVICFAIGELPAANVVKRHVEKKLLYWSVVLQVALLVLGLRIGTALERGDFWEMVFSAVSALLLGLILAPLGTGEQVQPIPLNEP